MKSKLISILITFALGSAIAGSFNDFDISNATIPLDEIRSGGPPRDGIPAIDQPKFIRPAKADFMQDDDDVLSVTVGGETRAYPLRILVWHEIVNDTLSGEAIAVTYCPLCGTAMVFSRRIGGRVLDFGVSGLLYQSDVLMYDRQTESLWSQLAMASVSGRSVNATLEWLPSQQVTWLAWTKKFPQGKVLSTQTGFSRNYSGNAYADYKRSSATMFSVPAHRSELLPKEWVIGVQVDGAARAYSIRVLAEQKTITDAPIEIIYDPESRLATAKNLETGETLPVVKVYWFAWQAFYPRTQLIEDDPDGLY